MKTGKKVRLRFERDSGGSGWWAITSPDAPGLVTQADTIEKGLKRAREALALVAGDEVAEHAELVRELVLPRAMLRKVDLAKQTRVRVDALAFKASKVTRSAAKDLTSKCKLTRRDTAAVLGISHQRVQQLLEE